MKLIKKHFQKFFEPKVIVNGRCYQAVCREVTG